MQKFGPHRKKQRIGAAEPAVDLRHGDFIVRIAAVAHTANQNTVVFFQKVCNQPVRHRRARPRNIRDCFRCHAQALLRGKQAVLFPVVANKKHNAFKDRAAAQHKIHMPVCDRVKGSGDYRRFFHTCSASLALK